MALWIPMMVACSSLPVPGEERGRPIVPPVEVDGVTWRAAVTTAPRAVPERFRAGLPSSPEALRTEPWLWPSHAQLVRGTCSGGQYRDGIAGAVRLSHAVKGVFVMDSWWENPGGWIEVLGGCTPEQIDATYCSWALGAFRDIPEAHPLVVEPCASDVAVREAMVHPDTPDDWVVAWSHRHGVVDSARVAQILERAVDRGYLRATDFVLLTALAEAASPDAGAVLLDLYERAPDSDVRITVGHQLWGRTDPEQRHAHARACALRESPSCDRDRAFDLEQELADADYDVAAVLANRPAFGSALRDALARCAVDVAGDGRRATRCLAAMARQNLKEARNFARSEASREASAEWSGLVKALQDPEGTRQELEAAGFGPFLEIDGGVPVDWLMASGEARFATEFMPIDADGASWWLAELLEFARLAIPSAVVGRAAIEPADTRQPRNVHLAWADGLRFRALGAPVGTPARMDRLVGFVNALLAHRKTDTRLAWGWAAGQRIVVRGRPSSLDALVSLGLFEASPPPR